MPSFRFSTLPAVAYQFTCGGVDEDKVKRAFEKVAKAMKPGERSVLRSYWIQHHGAPSFAIEDVVYFPTEQDGKPFPSLGMNVTGDGLKFRFAGRAMALLSETLVETLIAHELAHAVIRAEIAADDLPEEDEGGYKKLTKDLEAKSEGIEDEAELLKIVKANYSFQRDWMEAAVNRRLKSWNVEYDDAKVRAWLGEYLKANPPAPEAPPAPPPEPVPALVPAPVENVTGSDQQPGQNKNFVGLFIALALAACVLIILWLAGVI